MTDWLLEVFARAERDYALLPEWARPVITGKEQTVNYDQPREHKDGGWHYTSMNDGRVHAVGYCMEHPPHETEDDARRCYRDYELNERLGLDTTLGNYNPCEAPSGCTTLTNKAATVGGWMMWRLCDEHRTREVAAGLYGEMAGDSVHS